jgi:hypothetical protein
MPKAQKRSKEKGKPHYAICPILVELLLVLELEVDTCAEDPVGSAVNIGSSDCW